MDIKHLKPGTFLWQLLTTGNCELHINIIKLSFILTQSKQFWHSGTAIDMTLFSSITMVLFFQRTFETHGVRYRFRFFGTCRIGTCYIIYLSCPIYCPLHCVHCHWLEIWIDEKSWIQPKWRLGLGYVNDRH